MPAVSESTVRAFAHCTNPLCAGYRQEEVDAVRQETSYMFTDNGGDLPGIERSTVRYMVASEDDAECRSCGRLREVTDSPRPSYQPLSGYDPDGLINGSVPRYDPNKVNTVEDARVAELEAKIAAQDQKIDRLLNALESQGDDESEAS